MNIFTIGFTKISAEEFFKKLKNSGIKTLIDVRLNNQSQLAGYTKNPDFGYFLKNLINVKYQHQTLLAPTKEMLSAYRSKEISWDDYETKYLNLIESRLVFKKLRKEDFASACLLCSEATAVKCHRRLIAEYLATTWHDVKITHL